MKRPYIALIISVVVALGCVFLIPRVNVNSDMTKYLPDSSPMQEGLTIMNEEFSQEAMSLPDVRIMCKGLDEKRIKHLCDSLEGLNDVKSASVQTKEDYALFELTVGSGTNQKELATKIKKNIGGDVVSQTSQDGNTPDPIVLIIGISALIVVLFIMCSSWLEPLLFLGTIGLAVAVNMGTNAFLPYVSITTFSIGGVLQLVLSMDYSIILMSRYRQRKAHCKDKYTAMSNAAKKASRSIVSSALTTIVGLLMLVFMNLKIGADIGLVLAKGVLCSLIYVNTALPGLILLFDKGIENSTKRVPHFNTDGIASFCEKHRWALTTIFIVLFGGTFYWQSHTQMRFSTNFESPIDKVFPRKNAMVLLYDNSVEDRVCDVLDSAITNPNVEMAISYPSLMLKGMSAEQLTSTLKELGGAQTAMLNDTLMKAAFFAAKGPELRLSFPQVLGFVKERAAAGDSLFTINLGSGMQEKLALLDEVMPEADDVFRNAIGFDHSKGGPVEENEFFEEEIFTPVFSPLPAPKTMRIREYMLELEKQQPSALTKELVRITDASALKRKMDIPQMTAFMGSTPTQTKMVYSFSKNKDAGMTPIEFAHFLVDDLFKRKLLAPMVSSDQRSAMTLRMVIMDHAVKNADLPIKTLESLIKQFGVKTPLIFPEEKIAQAQPDNSSDKENTSAEGPVMAENSGTTTTTDTPTATPVTITTPTQPEIEAAPQMMQEDPRLKLLQTLMNPNLTYNAKGMSRNFTALGEKIDPETVELLYSYYGAYHCYDSDIKMSLTEFISFLKERIMSNDTFKAFIPEEISARFDGMQEQLDEGIGRMKGEKHSIAAIISNLKDESTETEAFIEGLRDRCDKNLGKENYHLIGESVMFKEMKDGFGKEMMLITLLTILAIFLIVTATFRSPITALILVIAVMSGVFVDVVVSGIGGSRMLYLAYLIVQSILMGATIDYAILFTNYYREKRNLKAAYKGSIHTIFTSGLIMVIVPGLMALLLDDAMVQPIVKSLSIGALAAVCIIMFILPGVLATVYKKK